MAHLYARDYRKITDEEREEYERILILENPHGQRYGRINHYDMYPEAVKHYLSLFPNNHLVLSEIKKKNFPELNNRFSQIVHDLNSTERDIARFIKDNDAYYIIASILNGCGFHAGHHATYLFPEFELRANGKTDWRADYLLLGKGSGGYEFVFVELESPNTGAVLQNGYPAKSTRSGQKQIEDWEIWLDSNYSELASFFEREKGNHEDLPDEFYHYDSTRMHYVLVAGTRNDYIDKTYRVRRDEKKTSGVILLHYDNLIDYSEELFNKNTF